MILSRVSNSVATACLPTFSLLSHWCTLPHPVLTTATSFVSQTRGVCVNLGDQNSSIALRRSPFMLRPHRQHGRLIRSTLLAANEPAALAPPSARFTALRCIKLVLAPRRALVHCL